MGDRMVSVAEQKLSQALRAVLADLTDGASIPDSDQFRVVLTGFQFFLPGVLAEIHREWRGMGLDDVVPVVARRTGDGEAEIFGLCCLISDQTLTPLHLRLQVAAAADEVTWLECRLGEWGPHGMVRKSYTFLTSLTRRLWALDGDVDEI